MIEVFECAVLAASDTKAMDSVEVAVETGHQSIGHRVEVASSNGQQADLKHYG